MNLGTQGMGPVKQTKSSSSNCTTTECYTIL